MNLNFDEFKNSDYDKERTFDFLQKVIAEKTPCWKEIVLNPKDFHISYKDLPEYRETAAPNLITFSLTAFEYLATDKREMLEKELWGTPYGYFYLWQYAINGLRYMDEDELSLVQKYLDPLVEDFDKTPDCNAFNHFGRILAVIKFNIYCTITKTDKTDEIHQTFNRLMHKTQQYKENELLKVAKGELDLDNVKVEDCKQTIHYIDELTGPYIASVGSYDLALLDEESRGDLSSDILKITQFVEDIRYESLLDVRVKLFEDINREHHEIQMFIRYDMSMAESKARIAKAEARRAEILLSRGRRDVYQIALEFNIHDDNKFFEGEDHKRGATKGEEASVINWMINSVEEGKRDELIKELADEDYGAPIFYKAYLNSKESEARIAELLETERIKLFNVAKQYNLLDNPAIFKVEGISGTTLTTGTTIKTKEALAINLFITDSIERGNKDECVKYLAEETPMFYQAYLGKE